MSDNLTELLERIQKREDNINSSMNEHVNHFIFTITQGSEYKRKNEEFKKVEANYKNLTNSIKEMGE